MAAQPLGPWGMEHEASIILSAHEALLRAAEVAFGLLTVAFAGVREQDPEDGKLERLHLLSWGGDRVSGHSQRAKHPCFLMEVSLSGSCSLWEPKNGVVAHLPKYTTLPQDLGQTQHQTEARGAF